MSRPCSKCGGSSATGRSYCSKCHAAYMREWRRSHPLTEEQRVKDRARSYAGVYLRRGKLKKEPCEACESPKSQMHHEDYSKPLNVIWLCRRCHLALHARRGRFSELVVEGGA